MITYSTVLVTFFITNQNNISILPSKKKKKNSMTGVLGKKGQSPLSDLNRRLTPYHGVTLPLS